MDVPRLQQIGANRPDYSSSAQASLLDQQAGELVSFFILFMIQESIESNNLVAVKTGLTQLNKLVYSRFMLQHLNII